MQKIKSIQHLRGIAALAVVFCHFGSSDPYPLLASLFNLGQTGVHLFFMISGFVIVNSLSRENYTINSFPVFLLKRSIRIDPSYWAAIALTFLLFAILVKIPGFKGQELHLDAGQLLAHVLYVVPYFKYPFYDHVFWTLGVEFQFYLIIGLLYFLPLGRYYKPLFVIVFAATCYLQSDYSLCLITTYSPIFGLGISLSAYYAHQNIKNLALPAALLLLIIFQFGPGIAILLLLASCYLLYQNSEIGVLNTLGNISYSLYLTHPLVGVVTRGFFKHFNVVLFNNPFFQLSTEVVAALTFAYCFYWLIEKPTISLSKKIKYKKQTVVSNHIEPVREPIVIK